MIYRFTSTIFTVMTTKLNDLLIIGVAYNLIQIYPTLIKYDKNIYTTFNV